MCNSLNHNLPVPCAHSSMTVCVCARVFLFVWLTFVVSMVPGPCQLHHFGKDHLFEESDCHSYCKFNISVCGGVCSGPGNCSCRPTKAKELETFAYCPWGKGLDPSEPTYRRMPFLIPLECGCVGCTADDGSETNGTYSGPSIVEKELNQEHPCPSWNQFFSRSSWLMCLHSTEPACCCPILSIHELLCAAFFH